MAPSCSVTTASKSPVYYRCTRLIFPVRQAGRPAMPLSPWSGVHRAVLRYIRTSSIKLRFDVTTKRSDNEKRRTLLVVHGRSEERCHENIWLDKLKCFETHWNVIIAATISAWQPYGLRYLNYRTWQTLNHQAYTAIFELIRPFDYRTIPW